MSEKQKSQQIIPKEITQLLEHRATLAKWLAKLEELSGTVRPDVYDRVRGDYEERLRSQETELTAHRSEMETALEGRRSWRRRSCASPSASSRKPSSRSTSRHTKTG
jgi:hypothetical protein